MNAKKIHVYSAGGAKDTFTADANKSMRVIIGKHGELRIMEVEILEDVDIEKKQQLEHITTLCVIHSSQWLRYENGDVHT